MSVDAERLFFEGNAHLSARNHASAETCYLGAVSLDPLLAEAHANLAWVMTQIGATARADEYYRRALELCSGHYELRLNYGAFLARLKRFEAAERVYTGAVDLDPSRASAWSNLSVLYVQLGRFEAAEECCRKSLSLDTGYDKAHVNLAYLCLRDGRLEDGFRHYEWRGWQASLEQRVSCPRWSGESLIGRSLLIAHEGGFGDAIQFSRYVALAKEAGAREVTLICPRPLKALLETLDGVDSVLSLEEPLTGHWDLWTSLMSMPHRFGTTLANIPAALPYVSPDTEEAAKWRSRLPKELPLIGIAWRGNPSFENDADRSIGAAGALRPLGHAGVNFVCALPDATDEDIRHTGLAMIRVGDDIRDFADTAALLSNLDLVISVDTAVAHLAGALGKPCWLMLPRHMPDWRWLSGRADSPWYPEAVRLYAQEADADWSSVIDEIASDLASWIENREAVSSPMPIWMGNVR